MSIYLVAVKLYTDPNIRPNISPSKNPHIAPIIPPKKLASYPTYIEAMTSTKAFPQPKIADQPQIRMQKDQAAPSPKQRPLILSILHLLLCLSSLF